MKTKLTVGEIVSSSQVLQIIANTKMPVKTSYRLNKMLRKVSKEVEIYEEERKKIFDELGEEIGEEGTLQIPKDKMDEATELFEELVSEEIEVELPEVTLEHLSSMELTPLELGALEPLLKINDDEPDLSPGMVPPE